VPTAPRNQPAVNGVGSRTCNEERHSEAAPEQQTSESRRHRSSQCKTNNCSISEAAADQWHHRQGISKYKCENDRKSDSSRIAKAKSRANHHAQYLSYRTSSETMNGCAERYLVKRSSGIAVPVVMSMQMLLQINLRRFANVV
jgi:hypothetical protein